MFCDECINKLISKGNNKVKLVNIEKLPRHFGAVYLDEFKIKAEAASVVKWEDIEALAVETDDPQIVSRDEHHYALEAAYHNGYTAAVEQMMRMLNDEKEIFENATNRNSL